MNAFNFGQLLMVKMAAPPSMLSSGPRPVSSNPATGQQNPMAAINAQRVAQMKAEAAKVRAASGVPSTKGTTGTGGNWSGRVMPNGSVQGAQYTPTPGAATLAPGAQPAAATQTARRQALKGPAPAQAPATRPTMNQMPAATQPATKQPSSYETEYQEWRKTQTPGNQPQTPSAPNTTTTPVDSNALQQQMLKLQQPQQSPAPPTDPARDRALNTMRDGFLRQGGGQPPAAVQPQNPGGLEAGGHIIRTDNGRLFDTIQKRFIEPPKGAVFGPPGAIHGPALPPR